MGSAKIRAIYGEGHEDKMLKTLMIQGAAADAYRVAFAIRACESPRSRVTHMRITSFS